MRPTNPVSMHVKDQADSDCFLCCFVCCEGFCLCCGQVQHRRRANFCAQDREQEQEPDRGKRQSKRGTAGRGQ